MKAKTFPQKKKKATNSMQEEIIGKLRRSKEA